jgi:hypothetical protein
LYFLPAIPPQNGSLASSMVRLLAAARYIDLPVALRA